MRLVAQGKIALDDPVSKYLPGLLPDGKRLWSPEQARQMWTPATITASSAGATADNPTRPILQTYALGWFVQDYRGLQMVQHSGGLSGQVTFTGLLPSRGIGVTVLSNVEEPVSSAVRNAILDRLIDAQAFDWVAAYGARMAKTQAEALAGVGGGIERAPPGGPGSTPGRRRCARGRRRRRRRRDGRNRRARC